MNARQAEQFARWSGLPASMRVDLRSWEAVPLTIDGETAGVAALDGTEIHFALAPTWRRRAITRFRARKFLAPLMDRIGFLTTRAIDPTPAQSRFLAGLGFERTRVDGEIHHYMLAALPFEREN